MSPEPDIDSPRARLKAAGYRLPADDAALLGECDVQVFRGSGPGGQSVNTADSAVRLIHRPSGIVVVCREERSQLRNKNRCLERLRVRLTRELAPPPPKRVPTRPSKAAKERRLAAKAHAARVKRARRSPGCED